MTLRRSSTVRSSRLGIRLLFVMGVSHLGGDQSTTENTIGASRRFMCDHRQRVAGQEVWTSGPWLPRNSAVSSTDALDEARDINTGDGPEALLWPGRAGTAGR